MTPISFRTKEIDDAQKTTLVERLETALSPNGVEVLSFDLVSPVVAQETVLNAFWAILAAAVGIFLYIWWAFRNVPSPLRYSVAAITALIHDVLIVIGIFAILGEVADTEVNKMFLIALLTVIGYSVNDTIVVFDRLRENVLIYPNRGFTEVVNLSISEDHWTLAEHQLHPPFDSAGSYAVRWGNHQAVPAGAAYRCGCRHLQLHRHRSSDSGVLGGRAPGPALQADSPPRLRRPVAAFATKGFWSLAR